jgi:pyrroline-5-carboxylate reductase
LAVKLASGESAAVKETIGFIGAGQMARALAAGFVRAKLVRAEQIWAGDPFEAARREFVRRVPGAHMADSNRQVAEAAEVLFLAVKPGHIGAVLEDLRPAVGARHLIASIAAGVPLARIAAGLGEGPRLMRVMPNTPCLVGQSASGYSPGPGATARDRQLLGELLSAVGKAFLLDEKLLDAVTGLAGSGPAFVYLMIEALSDGGVLMGLPREVATALAAQTVRGAAEMVLITSEHPAALKDRVASPGGTTIAGLQALETGGLRAALIDAVQAAARRSMELGQ